MPIDWQSVGTGVALFFAGAGAAFGAFKKWMQPAATPASTHAPVTGESAGLLQATLLALRDSTEAVRAAEEAVRGLRDTTTDGQASMGAQISALRDLVERLGQIEKRMRRVTKE